MSHGSEAEMSVARGAARHGQDWAGSLRAYLIAWGIPSLVLIGAALLSPAPRALVWSAVLAWMGSACLINSRRCGRVHCRYTGPYYLLLILPVALLGFGLAPFGPWAWWVLGALILFGTKIIWWATERAWGRYRT